MMIEAITGVWTDVMEWIVSSISSVQAVFYNETGLTFMGVLAVISVAIGLAFLNFIGQFTGDSKSESALIAGNSCF